MHPDLPTKAGFFWWRRVASDEWRMVQIVDWNNGGHTGTCYLSAYDVEHHDFGGRTMRAWSRFEDIGEWIEIRKPETLDEIESRRLREHVCAMHRDMMGKCFMCGSESLLNVKEHATPLAGASVERWVKVHVTGEVENRAASGVAVPRLVILL